LQYSLSSLVNQKRLPDEVLIVIKPCSDESEKVISRFENLLPLKIIYQNSSGNVVNAYELGYLNASGDVILFLDDDAIAHDEWILRYERLFNENIDAAGFTGLTYKAYLNNGSLIKTSEPFYSKELARGGPHRRPLPELKNYFGYISTSGIMGEKPCYYDLCRSVLFGGVNMGFRTSLIKDLKLSVLYRKSRKGFWFENIMAYWCVKKGFKTYEVINKEISPIVWHIEHSSSLTRGKGFWHEFWLHYDRVAMFWRLRKLGANVSTSRYILALVIMSRKKIVPRFLATLYGLITKI